MNTQPLFAGRLKKVSRGMSISGVQHSATAFRFMRLGVEAGQD